jgi:endoglucanase
MRSITERISIPGILCALLFPVLVSGQTVVEKNGQLRVAGNRVMNRLGEPVSFAGMSLFWSQWGGKYYNPEVIHTLATGWHCGITRAAMAVEAGGYLRNPEREKEKVKIAVESCIKEGIYIFIDWHDHNAHNHQEEAIAFFAEMAREYGEYPNVIYEIFNEPAEVSWKDVVLPYSVAVIKEIRKHDPDNLILVSVPRWCQELQLAAADPIEGFDNLVYSLHFYAASHKEDIRNKAKTALDSGLAVMASEWGTCEYTGDGYIDEESTRIWLDFMKENGISWCNWSLNDRKESASALKPGTPGDGNWTGDDLTESGKLLKEIITEW